MRRVLITGGTGFVGTHLIRFLKSNASKIAVIASGDSRSRQEPGVEYYVLDIRRADQVRSVVHSSVQPTSTISPVFLPLMFPGATPGLHSK